MTRVTTTPARSAGTGKATPGRLVGALGLLLLLLAPIPTIAAAAPAPSSEPGLGELAAEVGLRLGTAVEAPPVLDDPTYRGVLDREFTIGTPENHMKWQLIHPAEGSYDFAAADAIVDALEARGSAVRGHTLAWWNMNPDWLTSGAFTRDELITLLEDHIAEVAGRYQGRLSHWDVVNEAVGLGTPATPSPWSEGIGFPEYLDIAFRAARAADPDADLYYNDFGMEYSEERLAAVEDLVDGLQARGVPIDGVGFQAHLDAFACGDSCTNDLLARFLRFDARGLDVAVTELDVAIRLPVTEAALADQASVYRGVLTACMLAPNCDTVVVWGLSDAHSWIPAFKPGFGAATLLDESYQPKPAYDALAALFRASPVAPSCADHADQPSAQAAFDADVLGAPLLDPDGDGIACEQLPPTPTSGPSSTTTSTTTSAVRPVAVAATPSFTG